MKKRGPSGFGGARETDARPGALQPLHKKKCRRRWQPLCGSRKSNPKEKKGPGPPFHGKRNFSFGGVPTLENKRGHRPRGFVGFIKKLTRCRGKKSGVPR